MFQFFSLLDIVLKQKTPNNRKHQTKCHRTAAENETFMVPEVFIAKISTCQCYFSNNFMIKKKIISLSCAILSFHSNSLLFFLYYFPNVVNIIGGWSKGVIVRSGRSK